MKLKFDVKTMAQLHRSEQYPGGVKTAYKMGDLCGIKNGDVYSRVYRGDLTGIGAVTIERICQGFNCSPSDFIITRPDLLQPEGRELRHARNALGLSPEEFANIFSERVGFQFDATAVDAWERGKAKIREGVWQAIAMALIEIGHAHLSEGSD